MPKWMHILWPSFLTSILGETVFFALIDPKELYLLGEAVRWSPIAVYSTGFMLFWGLTSLTSALCFFFQRPAADFNSPPRSRSRGKHHLHSV